MNDYSELISAATKYKELLDLLKRYGADQREQKEAERILEELTRGIGRLVKTGEDDKEPNGYDKIVAASEGGAFVRELPADFEKKLRGALIGRLCGCILGAPVEGWAVDGMKSLAEDTGTPFPPTEYWHGVTDPEGIQYNVSKRKDFVLGNMQCCPTDDDTMYPLLNMMLVEEHGVDFTIDDVGKHWLKYMTVCFTAELDALENLKKGVKAEEACSETPFVEWIGAAIRADLFGWISPGNPARAAELAYRDAYLSHRRNGIYGEMYLAAVIAAAFTANGMEEALREGLKVIPKESALYRDLIWALDVAPQVKGYEAARKAVDEHFPELTWVDTRNNLCLIVFALMNANSFTEAISEIVAMGMDNDCTGATVGSIYGALHGIDCIEPRWYECFHGKILCFLKNRGAFEVEDVLKRLKALTEKNLRKDK